MFSSVQIKQEYNSIDDKNHQNTIDGQASIDYSVFNNQNIEYAYHQLPHFWDQALQVQSNHHLKDLSHRNNGLLQPDVSRFNQTIPFLGSNYINHYLEQQQQQQQQQQPQQQQQQPQPQQEQEPQNNNSNSFVTEQMNQQCPQITQMSQSNVENRYAESTITSAPNSNSLINPMLPTPTTKYSNLGRPPKYSNDSSLVKKVKYQCEICFKEFGHKSNLFIHMRTHNGERPYKCKECDKCFTHSGNLAIHMRTHSGERPYACQVCGKMFSHSGNLSTHLRTHSGIKPYKCSVCSKEFRHSGNLSIHERIHSGIKPFQCKICGKEFYHSGNLTTHMKKHPVMVSHDQCENNVIPVPTAEYICENNDQVQQTGDLLNINSGDIHNTLHDPKSVIVEEQLKKESKES